MQKLRSSSHFHFLHTLSISIVHFIHDVYSSFLAPVTPLLIEKFGFSLTQISALNIIQRIPSLLNPIVGIISEKLPIKPFILVTPLITAASMSLLGVAPNFTILAILLFIMGLSADFFHVPGPVIIRQVSGRHLGTGMSFYMVGGEGARAAGPVIITAAISLWGFEGTWKLIPFAVVATIIIYFALKKIPIEKPNRKKLESKGYKKTLHKLMPFFLMLIAITFFRSVMKSALTAFLPTYVAIEQNEGLLLGAYALAFLQFIGAAGTFMSGYISDKIGRKTTLVIAVLCAPIFMFLFTYTSGIMMFALLGLIGLFILSTTPVLLALVQENDDGKPAFTNSIFMTISFGTGAISVVLTGFMGDHIGLELTYRISAFIALGAIPFVFLLPAKQKAT